MQSSNRTADTIYLCVIERLPSLYTSISGDVISLIPDPLPQLRFEIAEAAQILRVSRATLYDRIRDGVITVQKDGRRTFITAGELQRYVSDIPLLNRNASESGNG